MSQIADKPQNALLLTAEQVAELLACSVRHVWRLADLGTLPKPLSLGAKLKRWPRSSIEKFIAEQSF